MRYTALDSGKIYYCFQDNVWTWVNKVNHANLTGLSEDDHTQYHTNARAAAWHATQAGYHIVGGNDHTHMTGEPAARIAHGWNIAKPENPEDGQVYFSTNLDGGTLFIGQGGVWRKMVGIPPGGIVAFNGPCPTGWTRYTALDGKLPMGSIASGVGETGGATQHRHAYTSNIKHYHSIAGRTLDASDAGGHTHSITIGTGNTGNAAVVPSKSSYASTTDYSTSDAGYHDHTAVVPQITTGTTGSATPYTDYASNYPASKEVVWCKKD